MWWCWEVGPLGGDEVMRVETPRRDQCPYKGDPRGLPCPFLQVRTQWEGAIYEPRSGSSSDTGSASALILDFQPPELWEMHALFKFPAHGACTAACMGWSRRHTQRTPQSPTEASTHHTFGDSEFQFQLRKWFHLLSDCICEIIGVLTPIGPSELCFISFACVCVWALAQCSFSKRELTKCRWPVSPGLDVAKYKQEGRKMIGRN